MLEKIINKYGKVLNVIEKVLNVICAILLSVMTVLMCYQVFMRYVLSNAPSWCEELIRYMFIYLTMLGSAAATRRSKHLVVDILVGSFPERTNRIIQVFFNVCIIAFLVILATYGNKLCMKTMNTVSPALKIPMGCFYAAIPIGSAMLILATIEQLLKNIYSLINREGVQE